MKKCAHAAAIAAAMLIWPAIGNAATLIKPGGVEKTVEQGVSVYRGAKPAALDETLAGGEPSANPATTVIVRIDCHPPRRLRTQGFYSGTGPKSRRFTQGFYSDRVYGGR